MTDQSRGGDVYPKSHQEIALSSIKCFKDDGTLDLAELNFLMGLALRDKVVDDDEKRVLGNIFDQAEQTKLSHAVRARIREVRRKYSI